MSPLVVSPAPLRGMGAGRRPATRRHRAVFGGGRDVKVNLIGDAAMTDEIMNLRQLVEKTQTPTRCAR